MDPSSPTKTEETAEESAKEEVPVLPSSPFIDSEYEFRAPMFYDFLNPVSDDDDADAFFDQVNTTISYSNPGSPSVSSPLYSSPYAPKSIEPRSPMRQIHADSAVKSNSPYAPRAYSPIPLKHTIHMTHDREVEGVHLEPKPQLVIQLSKPEPKPDVAAPKSIPSRYMHVAKPPVPRPQQSTRPIPKPKPVIAVQKPVIQKPRPIPQANVARPIPKQVHTNTYAKAASQKPRPNTVKRPTQVVPAKSKVAITNNNKAPAMSRPALAPRNNNVPVVPVSMGNKPTYAQVAATPPSKKHFMRPTAATMARQQAAANTRERITEKHTQDLTENAIGKDLLASVRRVHAAQKRYTPETLRRQREMRAAALTVPITPPFLKRPVRPAREVIMSTEQRQILEAQQARQRFAEDQQRKREELARRRAQPRPPTTNRSYNKVPHRPMNIKVSSN